jgi:hypothetical protein
MTAQWPVITFRAAVDQPDRRNQLHQAEAGLATSRVIRFWSPLHDCGDPTSDYSNLLG